MPAAARYADEQGATLAARVRNGCRSWGWQSLCDAKASPHGHNSYIYRCFIAVLQAASLRT